MAQRCAGTSKQTGKPCGRYVKDGFTVCKFHGASTPQAKAGARRRLEAAEAGEQLAQLGVAVETTPVEALEAMLNEAAGNVVVLRELVNALGLQDGQAPEMIHTDTDLAYDAIYGRTYHESGMPTGKAEQHVLVVMYHAERDRLAKLAEAMSKLGLDERRVKLAEAQIERLFQAVGRAVKTLPAELAEPFRLTLAHELRALPAA